MDSVVFPHKFVCCSPKAKSIARTVAILGGRVFFIFYILATLGFALIALHFLGKCYTTSDCVHRCALPCLA
jgi:hypothetical protein